MKKAKKNIASKWEMEEKHRFNGWETFKANIISFLMIGIIIYAYKIYVDVVMILEDPMMAFIALMIAPFFVIKMARHLCNRPEIVFDTYHRRL